MCQKSRETAKREIKRGGKICINFKSQPVKTRAGTPFRAPTWHKTNPQTNAQNVNILPKKKKGFSPSFTPSQRPVWAFSGVPGGVVCLFSPLPARAGAKCLKFNSRAKFYCISGTTDLYPGPSRLFKGFSKEMEPR